MDFEQLYKELKTEIGSMIKDKFGKESKDISDEVSGFVDDSKDKLERWAKLFAKGHISKEELELLLKSQKDLFVIQSLHKAGVSKIALGHFKNKIVTLIFTKLIAFI
ncbi:MAG: hypothetical protein AAF361_13995 [Bacteroidota bacterium]